MELVYLSEGGISTDRYCDFLYRFYGKRIDKRKQRNQWYCQLGENYKVLLAIENGEILGQNCAYKVDTVCDGERVNVWWGVDAFVLSEYRGKGIGTKLQKKLHSDLPNFTSASYSRPNGSIKRKLGDRPIFKIHHYYYGVSCYFSVFLSLAFQKLFGKPLLLKPEHGFPYLYSSLCSSNIVLQDASVNEELSTYMDDLLKKQYDFYVKRSVDFLQWKYINNPSMESHLKYIVLNGSRVGFVAYCSPKFCSVAGTPTQSLKITDILIDSQSDISSKDVVVAILKECKRDGYHVDGILSINRLKGLPAINYHNIDVLSSMGAEEPILNPYLTLLDQDMEQ